MRKIVIASLIAMLLFACSNSKSGQPGKIQRDTIPVLALYVSAIDGHVKSGIIRRVIQDSFMFTDIDTITMQKKWVKDTSYIIQYNLLIDSAESKRNGNVPITDSLGRKILYPYFLVVDKSIVASGWDRADSTVFKKLKSKR